jgi:ribosomal protein S18 acetylase RimI-like enzyme
VVNATTAEDAPIQYFAIRKDGKPVCTSFLYLEDGVAGIYCVATIPEERGRGLGAHATAEPLRLARKLGFCAGVLQSSPAGHSLYRKLGFVAVGEVPLYVKMPV